MAAHSSLAARTSVGGAFEMFCCCRLKQNDDGTDEVPCSVFLVASRRQACARRAPSAGMRAVYCLVVSTMNEKG